MPQHHAVAAHLFQSNSMRIASWNVNSVKARLDIIINWLKSDSCDVLLLQETKSQDENFPHEAFSSIGWHVAIHGQKSYNGVAIASRHQIDDVLCGLPGDDTDEQARYIEASIQNLRVASIYLPNGNPAPGPKFDYKLQWMDRLNRRAATLLATWDGDALTRPETRQAFHRLTHAGYCDALRARHPHEVIYTYWDYQAGAWQRDNGVRIDHLLLSPEAVDRLGEVGVDKAPRGLEKPSDHTPIWCELHF